MGALRDGWLVFYNHDETPAREELVGQLCVCAVPSGQRFIRFLAKGSRPLLWTLESVTGEPMVDTPLLWAERVVWIRQTMPGDVLGAEADVF
jgi:hypothetical protein